MEQGEFIAIVRATPEQLQEIQETGVEILRQADAKDKLASTVMAATVFYALHPDERKK